MMPYPSYVYNTPVVPVYQPQPQYVAPMPMPQQIQSQPQVQQQPQPQPQVQQSDQLVNGGYVIVPSIEEAQKYPVAPGNLVTFKIENEPVIVEKSMSHSQFDSPKYKYFRLSEFNTDEKKEEAVAVSDDIKDSIKHIENRLNSLGDSYTELKKLLSRKQESKNIKKEEGHD